VDLVAQLAGGQEVRPHRPPLPHHRNPGQHHRRRPGPRRPARCPRPHPWALRCALACR